MFKYRYIPAEGLAHLKAYRYACTDLSLMTNYVMQPIWTRLIALLPSWLACAGACVSECR